mmetsp:Transcript_107119/g.255734  ORF Transcript_107119/g.255734 Transcript_107119/m.255734 type:complete len:220 (+) Transcript_107119:3848-4507(+)
MAVGAPVQRKSCVRAIPSLATIRHPAVERIILLIASLASGRTGAGARQFVMEACRGALAWLCNAHLTEGVGAWRPSRKSTSAIATSAAVETCLSIVKLGNGKSGACVANVMEKDLAFGQSCDMLPMGAGRVTTWLFARWANVPGPAAATCTARGQAGRTGATAAKHVEEEASGAAADTCICRMTLVQSSCLEVRVPLAKVESHQDLGCRMEDIRLFRSS